MLKKKIYAILYLFGIFTMAVLLGPHRTLSRQDPTGNQTVALRFWEEQDLVG